MPDGAADHVRTAGRDIMDDGYRQLRHARSTLEAGRRCLDEARSRLRRRSQQTREIEVPGTSGVPGIAPNGIDAWLELGDGSLEQDETIRQAVNEIVQLQLLLIEALCRHFPAIAPAIRTVAQHLLENATNLTDDNCCEGSASLISGQVRERMN